MLSLKYAIVTPARNEEACIEKTIRSMIAQTFPPTRWVIVSDGSTDATDEIVRSYLNKVPWISYIRLPERRERQFAAKVTAFNAGWKQVEPTRYDIIGNLDADITFDCDYFEYLVGKFEEAGDLGVAGTPFVEEGRQVYDYRFTNIDHVSGACQLFRKQCFYDIGGYQPVKGGGIDWIAVTTARMKGWKTRTFIDKVCHHHRTIGTGNQTILKSLFKHGQKDYYLGGHAIWQLFRSVYQIAKPPYVIGGLLLFAGYLSGWMRRVQRPVSPALVAFHRREQMTRLRNKLGLT